MFKRSTSGSIVCPGCGRLVGVQDEKCLGCGRVNPGLWGFAPWLARLGRDFGFMQIVLYGCLSMFGLSLLLAPSQVGFNGIFNLLSPGGRPLMMLGMSGAAPVFQDGRWWTVLSAAWLHGSALHIILNVVWIQRMSEDIRAQHANYFGFPQLVIIYTASSITGFLLSSVMGLATFLGPFAGAWFTVGASAPLFGLFGALVYYGQATGNRAMVQHGSRFAILWIAIGFLMAFGDIQAIRIDNWAHLGGFGGGWLTARLLRPNPDLPDDPRHTAVAIACLVLALLSIALSVAVPLPAYY